MKRKEDHLIHTALVVGAGRLAWSLIPALQDAGIRIDGIVSRSVETAIIYAEEYSLPAFSSLDNLPKTDAVFLTVPDAVISEMAAAVTPFLADSTMLIHTSGSVDMNALGESVARGVLYPMQAFTKGSVVSLREPDVPVFVEGSTPEIEDQLLALAQRLSGKAQRLTSEARRRLHLGAVIACNFSNLMYRLTDLLTPEVEISVFESLIRNQVELAMSLGPEATQTGPAVRGDQQTIDTHLAMLEDRPAVREMYLALSRMINPSIQDPMDA